MFFGPFRQPSLSSSRRAKRGSLPVRASRKLRVEALEVRHLLSVVPSGGEFRVNTYWTAEQLTPSVAMDSSGDFVVVWSSNQDADGYGICAAL